MPAAAFSPRKDRYACRSKKYSMASFSRSGGVISRERGITITSAFVISPAQASFMEWPTQRAEWKSKRFIRPDCVPGRQTVSFYTFRKKKPPVFPRPQTGSQTANERCLAGLLFPAIVSARDPGYGIIRKLLPHTDEPVISKTARGAFGGSSINHILKRMRIDNLLVAGMYTNHCVMATCMSAAELQERRRARRMCKKV
jgi:nicotinamidase-related amidase